jgi:hypothetical protein
VTGFFFPRSQVLPSHIVGVISLIVLAAAIVALYVYRLAGPWRWIYVAGAVLALYLNIFVGIVQAFQKPPFLVTQLVVLAIFILLGVMGVKRFHPDAKAFA